MPKRPPIITEGELAKALATFADIARQPPPWSRMEDEILRRLYNEVGPAALARKWETATGVRRSHGGIEGRAMRLGLCQSKKRL
jgi:hypothetical protein